MVYKYKWGLGGGGSCFIGSNGPPPPPSQNFRVAQVRLGPSFFRGNYTKITDEGKSLLGYFTSLTSPPLHCLRGILPAERER
jgi:hypothetical protein